MLTSKRASSFKQVSFGKMPKVNLFTVSQPIISAGLSCGKNFKTPNSIKMAAIEYLRMVSLFCIMLVSCAGKSINSDLPQSGQFVNCRYECVKQGLSLMKYK